MKYLERYISLNCDQSLNLQDITLSKLTVVIPAYKESIEVLTRTLTSLDKAADFYGKVISVIVLINYRDRDNETVARDSESMFGQLSGLTFNRLQLISKLRQLKGKKAGVGEARKILMDNVFYGMVCQELKGLIINLDADTEVAQNYFKAIDFHFENNPHVEAGSIAFSHNLLGTNSHAIIAYELHLRCFVNMQRILSLPFAYQTVGSAMVVRRNAYAKEGGMVRRQAGEDFYFLHKYSKNLSLSEINTTVVIPSDRESDRVPFGTGKAVNDIKIEGHKLYTTYNPMSFELLDSWLTRLFQGLKNKFEFDKKLIDYSDEAFSSFLISVAANEKIKEAIENVTSFDVFIKRFFNWFDAFMLMKYLHYMRDHGYSDILIDDALDYLFTAIQLDKTSSRENDLRRLRAYDLKMDYENQWRAALISKLSKITAS